MNAQYYQSRNIDWNLRLAGQYRHYTKQLQMLEDFFKHCDFYNLFSLLQQQADKSRTDKYDIACLNVAMPVMRLLWYSQKSIYIIHEAHFYLFRSMVNYI